MASRIDPTKPVAGANATTESIRANFREIIQEFQYLITGTGTTLSGTGLAVAQLGTGIAGNYDAPATSSYRRILKLRRAYHLPGEGSNPTTTYYEPLYLRFRLLQGFFQYGPGSYPTRIAQETTLAEYFVSGRTEVQQEWSVITSNNIGFNFVQADSDTFYLDMDIRQAGKTRLQVVETNGTWELANQEAVNPESYPTGETVLVRSPKGEFAEDAGVTKIGRIDAGLRIGRSFRLDSAPARKDLCNYLFQFLPTVPGQPWNQNGPPFERIAFIRVKNTSSGSVLFIGGSMHELPFGTNIAYNGTQDNPTPNPIYLQGYRFIDFYSRANPAGQTWGQTPGEYTGNSGGWIASDNSCTLLLFPIADGITSSSAAEEYVCNIAALPGNHVYFGTGLRAPGPEARRLMVPAWWREHDWSIGKYDFEPAHHGPLSAYLVVEVWLIS